MSDCLIFPVWNRGGLLRNSLQRLSELTVPDEILVVDDGSTDETSAVCAWARDELGLPIRRVYTHRPGEQMCSHAKNVGVKATDCDLVVTSEPEMVFETDVVAQMREQHAEDQTWGTQRAINAGTIRHGQRAGRICGCGCGEPYHVTKNWQAYWVTLFRRDWLLDVGGWDERFPDPWGWDDVDLGTRLRVRGVGQYNDLDVVATHQWHQPREPRDQSRNEAYFRNKGFHSPDDSQHPDIVANAGHEWGVPVKP